MRLIAINTIMGVAPIDDEKADRVKPGQVFDIDDAEAETIIAGGFAKEAPEQPAEKAETAAEKKAREKAEKEAAANKAKAEGNAG